MNNRKPERMRGRKEEHDDDEDYQEKK